MLILGNTMTNLKWCSPIKHFLIFWYFLPILPIETVSEERLCWGEGEIKGYIIPLSLSYPPTFEDDVISEWHHRQTSLCHPLRRVGTWCIIKYSRATFPVWSARVRYCLGSIWIDRFGLDLTRSKLSVLTSLSFVWHYSEYNKESFRLKGARKNRRLIYSPEPQHKKT